MKKLTKNQFAVLEFAIARQYKEAGSNVGAYAVQVYDQDITHDACVEAGIDLAEYDNELPDFVLRAVHKIEFALMGTTADYEVIGEDTIKRNATARDEIPARLRNRFPKF